MDMYQNRGKIKMRIAVTYEDGQVFQHFGQTRMFKLYDVADGQVIGQQLLDTNGQGHGALVWVLKEADVDLLICGGIGMGARNGLEAVGIVIYPGVQGEADAAVAALLQNELQFDPEATCQHHEHEHGHDCGEHDCNCH